MKNLPVLFYQEGTCSVGALISLLWLNQPFELCRLEENDNENEDYLTLNGLGEVPTLFLNGRVLTENSAILPHIALQDLSKKLIFKAGSPEYDQWMRALGFLSSTVHKSFLPLHKAEELTTDKKAQDEIKKNTIEKIIRPIWQYTNDHLLRTTFMYDHPMPIDAYLYVMTKWGEEFFDIAKDFPHIKRFKAAMESDPAVKVAMAIESGKQKDAIMAFKGHKDFTLFAEEAAQRKCDFDAKNHDGAFTPGLQAEDIKRDEPGQAHA